MRRSLALDAVVGALALSAFATLWSSPAAAQITRFDFDGQPLLRLAREDCEGEEALQVLEINVNEINYILRYVTFPITGPGGACPTDLLEPLTEVVVEPEQVTAIGGRILINEDVLPAIYMGDDACGAEGARANVFLCVQLYRFEGDLEAVLSDGINLDFDTELPVAPTVASITGASGKIVVELEDLAEADETDDAYEYIAEFRPCGGATTDGGVAADSLCDATEDWIRTTATDELTITIGNVDDGEEFEVRVLAVDDFDNEGLPSDAQLVTPVADQGALGVYDGGVNALSCDPGCEEVDASTAALGFFFLGGLSRLRRRRGVERGGRAARATVLLGIGLVLVAGALAGSDARADVAPALQDPPGILPDTMNVGRATVGLSIGAYHPGIDAEPGLNFPIYDCFFNDSTLPEMGADVDLHLVDFFGSLQLSLGFNLTQAQGFAQELGITTCGEPTTTNVELTMAKLRPGLTYRFDPFLDWVGFPLVPYGRVGLVGVGYAFTRDFALDTGGVDKGHNPLGLRLGYEAALGLMLAMDFLDAVDPFTPSTTKRARANGLFEHTFFFVEASYADISGFGQPGLRFTPEDRLFNTGFPLVWRLGVAVELL